MFKLFLISYSNCTFIQSIGWFQFWLFIFRGKWNRLLTGSFVQEQRHSRVKRKKGRKWTKKAFESVIDEVALFHFKASESHSGSVLTLSTLSVAEVKHVTCLSSHWNPTPAAANKNIKTMQLLSFFQSGATHHWLFSPILEILRLKKKSFDMQFYWLTCFVPRIQWSPSKRIWDFIPPLYFLLCRHAWSEYLCLFASEFHVNAAFQLCGFRICLFCLAHFDLTMQILIWSRKLTQVLWAKVLYLMTWEKG